MVSRVYRWFCKLSRLFHLLLGLSGLWLMLFFSVTGFMLNHEDWFGMDEPQRTVETGVTPKEYVEGPDKLLVVEHLRSQFGIVGRLETFEVEEEELHVLFKKPGLEVEAVIQREDGSTILTRESRGLAGWLTDLHRGKTTTVPWGVAIDLTSILFLLIAVSGLLLWFTLYGRRRLGLYVLSAGLVVSIALIYLASPR